MLTDSMNPADNLKKFRMQNQFLSNDFKGGGQIVPLLGIKFDTAGLRRNKLANLTKDLCRYTAQTPI